MLPYKFIACLLIYFALVLPCKAQLPVCSGSGLIYYRGLGTGYQDTIYNFDPSQPISATNPVPNTIVLPFPAGSATRGLSVNENLNATGPSPTFYINSVTTGLFYYYNGSTWINTGHNSGVSGGALGGGGGYIYCHDHGGGTIYAYNGSANATLILSSLPISNLSDIACDCNGNFFLLSLATTPQWLRKYNNSGALVNSWTVSGATAVSYGGGLAIFGNDVYYNNSSGFWHGVISGTNVSFSLVIAGGLPHGVSEFASCPLGNYMSASKDSVFHCSGSPSDTLAAIGTGPFSWSVISGPATISGTGDTVTVNGAANSNILLSSSATGLCGNSTDTVRYYYIGPPVISSNSPLCPGDSLSLTISANNVPGITYNWTGPNSFSHTTQNTGRANMQFIDSGNYIISISKAGCIKSVTEHVIVKPLPAAPSASNNSPVCAGDSLKFTASTTSAGVTYGWTGPGSFTSSIQNPFKFPTLISDSGNYIVTVTLNGCKAKDTTHVSINVTPTKPTANSNSPVCAGGDLNLSVNSLAGAIYSWTGPNSFNSTSQNPSKTNIVATDTGNYIVEISLNGCSSKDTTKVVLYIYPAPTIEGYVSPNDTICAGQNVTFTTYIDNFNTGVSPTCRWLKNGNFVWGTGGFTTHNISNNDVFTCELQALDLCDIWRFVVGNSIQMHVISNPPPSVILSANPPYFSPWIPEIFTTNVVGTGLSYRWTKNGITIPGALGSTYVCSGLNSKSTICVIVHSNKECAIPDSAIACAGFATEIENTELLNLQVYPNPVIDELIIEWPDVVKSEIMIYNIMGQELLHAPVNKQKEIISVKNFLPGTYILQITDGDGNRVVRKVVKE